LRKSSVNGDRHRLRQLFLNLADNAVKYNRTRGRVTMNLRLVNDGAEFTIANTGAAIPAEFLPRLFNRFFAGMQSLAIPLTAAGWAWASPNGLFRHIPAALKSIPWCQKKPSSPFAGPSEKMSPRRIKVVREVNDAVARASN
jgi:Histidine kinase-, DNA gyrase B-, and HSP90-like ATPase